MVNLIEQMRDLGLIAQVSSEEALTSHLQEGSKTVYCGFDPTADSLHIGNLVPLLALRRFQMQGHRPILLVGGATGMIGDPGGRSSERDLKPAEQVKAFVASIREQASRFLDFDCGENSAVVVDNATWTENLNVIDYLRDIGKHFSVNAMVQKETVKRRLEDDASGISYTEFSYMILQSYDFAILNRDYDCTIQMGGSDQWGNITSGIDLVRRLNGSQAHAITYPLITNSDGTKFGKSMGNAVWIDAKKTSPYSFYQFWRNTADADVIQYLRIFTFLSPEEIETLKSAHEQDQESESPVRLAAEVTELVHGKDGVEAAERIAAAMFSNQLATLNEQDLAQLAQDGLPSSEVEGTSVNLLDALVSSGLAVTPKGEVTIGQARKLVQGNAVAVNGEKVADIDMVLEKDEAMANKYVLIQKGKKNHHLMVFA